MLRIIEPPLQHLEIAGDHGQKVVEVVGDTASELSNGLHLLRLPEILLHFDARRQVSDEAGEDMGPAKRHLADREVHRKDRAVLAPRLDFGADADDVLLADPQVWRQVAVMVLAMRRGHEHLEIAADHFTGSVAKQFFCGFAEGLDDATLIDRDNRVGGGIENGAEARFSLFQHRLCPSCLRNIRVELHDRYRIATVTPVQCPPACYYHSTAIAVSAHKFTLPYSPIQQLNLNFRQRYRKLSREEFIGDASDGLFHGPAIKHLKAATPEQDFAIEFAYHRWHLIQGIHEFVELLLLCLALRFVRFAVGDVTGDAVESHWSAVRVAGDRRVVFQPAHLAIGTDDAVLDGHGAFFDQFGKHLGNQWPILRVNNVHKELRVCIKGAGRSAIDPFGARVKVQRLVGVRGNGPYDVLDGRQDGGQSFFDDSARFQSCPAGAFVEAFLWLGLCRLRNRCTR